MPEQFLDIIYRLEMLGISFTFIAIFLAGLGLVGYIVFLFWKYRNREEHSLDYVIMQDPDTQIGRA